MEQGTRETKSFFLSHPASRENNNDVTNDLGLSKRAVLAAATFSGAVLTNGGGGLGVFKVYDLIGISGTSGGLNNGERTVLAVTATTLTCDFPFKTEGPTANVEVRTQ